MEPSLKQEAKIPKRPECYFQKNGYRPGKNWCSSKRLFFNMRQQKIPTFRETLQFSSSVQSPADPLLVTRPC